MKRKKLVIGGTIILIILVIIMISLFMKDGSESEEQPAVENIEIDSDMDTSEEVSEEELEENSDEQKKNVKPKDKDTSKTEKTDEESDENVKGEDASEVEEDSEEIADEQKEEIQEEIKEEVEEEVKEDAKEDEQVNQVQNKIELPYKIPGTNLVIEKIAGYNGVYIEDGSDSDVSGVATILVKNTGTEAVEYADISFVHGGEDYSFKVSALPAGAKAAVQEENKSSYEDGESESCTASTAVLEKLEMSEDSVKVTDNGDGTLTVKNLTNKSIPAVRVFYKFYMDDEDAYIGGITYTAKIEGLGAGDSQTVRPSHYDSDSSKVMMVRTYDTAE